MSNLPKGWVETKLVNIVDITSSKRIFYSEYVDFGIAFYRSKEIIEKQKGNSISTELFITEEKYNEIKNNFGVPVKDDLLLTSVGTLGIPYLVKENEIFYFKDGNLTWFRNYKGLEPKFLYFYILSPVGKKRLNEMTIGSTQSALTISGLKKLKLELPPLDEQKEIANILSSFDKKIELLKEQNQTLETMAQTIFKEWFVDFNYPNATGEMIDSEMGEIPKDWRVWNLKNLSDVISKGTTPIKTKEDELLKNIYFLKVKDVTDNGNIKYDSLEKISSEIHKTVLKRSQLMTNDLLYSIAGTIGRVAILPKQLDYSNCNQALAFIRLKDKNKYLEYIHQWIQTSQIKNKINSSIVQGVQANVSLTVLGNLLIIIPDDKTVENWMNIIKPIYKKIKNNSEQIQILEETRDFLLPKLMSGKIRLKDFDESN